MKKRFHLKTFPIEGKTVLLRVDFNTPLNKGKLNQRRVIDNYKLKAALPTINYLIKNKCKVIILTHLGRPKGKIVASLRVDSLAQELQKLLPKQKIIKLDNCIGKKIKEKIEEAGKKELFLLENLRFYREELENDSAFAHSLASLAEVYINDAFGVIHRKHASISAITKFLPSMAGFLIERELHQLSKALKPKRPAVWIMGGAKLNKIELIEYALKQADYVLLGGALTFPFLRAKGIPIGMSKSDHTSVKAAKRILKKRNAKKIIFPLDFVTAERISTRSTAIEQYNHIKPQQIALDLGPATIDLFKKYLRKAHTIVWNGPLGYTELANFAVSTKEIGRFMDRLTATIICGGGETAAAMRKFHLNHGFTHVSTGGGAAIAFLTGEKLIGISALEKNYKKFKCKNY